MSKTGTFFKWRSAMDMCMCKSHFVYFKHIPSATSDRSSWDAMLGDGDSARILQRRSRAPSHIHALSHNTQTSSSHSSSVYIPQRYKQAARGCVRWLQGYAEASWGGRWCHWGGMGQASAVDREHVPCSSSYMLHCLHDICIQKHTHTHT